MKVTDYTHIKASDAKKVVEALNVYLATLHVHYSNPSVVTSLAREGKVLLWCSREDRGTIRCSLWADWCGSWAHTDARWYTCTQVRRDTKASKLQQSDYTYQWRRLASIYSKLPRYQPSVEREVLAVADAANDISTNDLITGYLYRAREECVDVYCFPRTEQVTQHFI